MTFLEFLNFISQNGCHFIGFIIVLSILTIFSYKLITKMWGKLISAITIWRKGYPPEHCDVSGKLIE